MTCCQPRYIHMTAAGGTVPIDPDGGMGPDFIPVLLPGVIANTLAHLKALTTVPRPVSVALAGRDAPGDGHGGVYFWSPGNDSPADDVFIIAPDIDDPPGRWLALGLYHAGSAGASTVIDVRFFGAVGAAGVDSYPGIQAAIDYAKSLIVGATVILPGPGVYSLKSGELVLDSDNITVIVDQGAVLEQATYGWSTIQIRNADGCCVLGPGKIRNPATKTPITGALYDGQAPRQRACGVYVYEANDTTVDGLDFENMFVAVSLRPADPLTGVNRNNRVTNIYSTHHDFGLLTQAQYNLIVDDVEGYITDLTQPDPNLPPHLIYISNAGGSAPKSRNVTLTNIVDEDNQFSSSIKVKHTDGLFGSGWLTRNVARGYDINADNYVIMGPQVSDLVDIGDSQQGGIVLLETNNGEIVSPIVTTPVGDNQLEAITTRAPSSNILVRGGRLTANRSSPSAVALVRLNGGSGHKFIEVETVNAGADALHYLVASTVEDSAIVRPIVKNVASSRIAQVAAGAIRTQIQLDLQMLNFTETNASLVNAGTDTLVAYSGRLPTRALATLPDPAVYADTAVLVTNGANEKPQVISRNSVWWYPDGTTVQPNAEALAWKNKVVALGGTVSDLVFNIVVDFIAAEKATHLWFLTDDYWPLWGENTIQSSVSLKRRVVIEWFGEPIHTPNFGRTFDGITQYGDTKFNPSLHAVAMAGDDLSLSVYEVVNLGASPAASSAGVADSSVRNLFINPRSSANALVAVVNCSNTVFATGITTSVGLSMVQHAPGPVFESFKSGVSLGNVSPDSVGTVLPTRNIYIGAINNAGVAGSLRAAAIGFVCVGASLDGTQAQARSDNIHAWAAAIGAPS